MKPIDMSKEPTCAKEHNPPLLGENVVTGPGNALAIRRRVHFGGGTNPLSLPASQFDTIKRVACMCRTFSRCTQTNRCRSTRMTRSHTIFTPCRNATRNGINRSPWRGADRHEMGKSGIHRGEMQHSSLDARLLCSPEHLSLCGDGQRGKLQLEGASARQVYGDAWQEQYSTQSQEVTVGPTGAASVNFVFKVTPYLY